MKKLGIDGKPLLHCVQCNRSYGYWQVFGITTSDLCLSCGEPLIFKEELNKL